MQALRAITVFDNHSRKCYAIEVGQSLKSIDVVTVMNRIKAQHVALPESNQQDNGSEFISKDFDKWSYENSVVLDYSRPRSQTDNPFIESFNDSMRD